MHGWPCLLFLFIALTSADVIRVDGDHRRTITDRRHSLFQRRREAAVRYNRRVVPSQDVILAPLEGRPVITKERMYVNAKDERDDKIYDKLFIDLKAASGLDLFFVTAPPLRTRMPEKAEPTTSIPPTTTHALETPPLRLITLAKQATTTPPPFKYASKSPRDTNQLSALPQPTDISNSAVVRFPAQPWQLPPKDPNGRALNPWEGIFEPQQLFPGIQPPNPFFLNQFAVPNATMNPFVPIGVSNPQPFLYNNFQPQPMQPPQMPVTPAPFEVPMVHKSSLRSGGYAKNSPAAPIPLPAYPYTPPTAVPAAQPIPADLSIDAHPTFVTKEDTYKSGAKTFIVNGQRGNAVEGGSEQLKVFAKHHPSIMTTAVRRPEATMKESQLVLPKMLTTSPRVAPIVPVPSPTAAPVPVSSLTPNQKLFSCCQKQQVGAACQAMCNFDTFSDKSLVSAFLTNQCPGPQLGQAYDCASSKANHSECCERNGLANFQGGRCMPFCRTHLATPPNVLEYLPCLQVFETIKYCYRDYQISHRNIFGD